MDITNTTVIKQGRYQSEKARHQVEIVILNDKLNRVQATVYEPGGTEEKHLGYISFENNSINCSLTTPEYCRIKDLLEDFEIIIQKAMADIHNLTV